MKQLPVLAFVLFITSCNNENGKTSYNFIECPPKIADAALQYAYQYAASNTSYHYGGQDLLKSIKIDCSGLIVNCYSYAVLGTPYALPFNDANVANLFSLWTIKTTTPASGDLIFMGENPSHPSHVALFVDNDSGYIHFIDATFKPDEVIDGVSIRKYKCCNPIFLSFGKIKLQFPGGK